MLEASFSGSDCASCIPFIIRRNFGGVVERGILVPPEDENNFGTWNNQEETQREKLKQQGGIAVEIDGSVQGRTSSHSDEKSKIDTTIGPSSRAHANESSSDLNHHSHEDLGIMIVPNSVNSRTIAMRTPNGCPHGAPVGTSNPIPAVKSSLKTCRRYDENSALSVSKRTGQATTARRVHGLWSTMDHADCPWTKLRNETMLHILGFLDLADKLRVGMVSKRYRSIVQDKSLWRSVDATEFVKRTNEHYLLSTGSIKAAQEQTGKTLQRIFQQYRIPSCFTVRNIHNRLSADDLPSLSGLEELTFTHFDSLSDTHVHVLLLMNSNAGTIKRPLRRLALEHCPQLGNACVRSIASQCPSLEFLSLVSCHGITNIDALRQSFTTNPTITPTAFSVPPNVPKAAGIVGLSSMFGPPPSSCFLPEKEGRVPQGHSRRPSPPPTSTLQGLFIIPGTSPPRQTVVSAARIQRSPNRSTPVNGGRLREVNLQGSGVQTVAISRLLSDRY
jgi:hypothetical protein